MKIIFDIEKHKEFISTNWEIDLSKPLPMSIGDPTTGLCLRNIRIERDKDE